MSKGEVQTAEEEAELISYEVVKIRDRALRREMALLQPADRRNSDAALLHDINEKKIAKFMEIIQKSEEYRNQEKLGVVQKAPED
jgi:hypothetical protein